MRMETCQISTGQKSLLTTQTQASMSILHYHPLDLLASPKHPASERAELLRSLCFSTRKWSSTHMPQRGVALPVAPDVPLALLHPSPTTSIIAHAGGALRKPLHCRRAHSRSAATLFIFVQARRAH